MQLGSDSSGNHSRDGDGFVHRRGKWGGYDVGDRGCKGGTNNRVRSSRCWLTRRRCPRGWKRIVERRSDELNRWAIAVGFPRPWRAVLVRDLVDDGVTIADGQSVGAPAKTELGFGERCDTPTFFNIGSVAADDHITVAGNHSSERECVVARRGARIVDRKPSDIDWIGSWIVEFEELDIE